MSENIGIEAKSLGALQPEKHRRNSHTEKECIANRTLRTLQAEKHRRMSHAEKHLYCRALAFHLGLGPPRPDPERVRDTCRLTAHSCTRAQAEKHHAHVG